MRRRLWALFGLVSGSVLLASCAVNDNLPQSGLNPAGDVAQDQKNILIPVVIIAGIIFVVVEALLVWFLIRYRHREGNEPSQIHGHSKLEVAWTIAPALVLAVVAVPTVSMIYSLAEKPAGNPMTVYAVGHQWWWEFIYPDQKVTTAGVMHVPAGAQVYIELCAAGSTNSGTAVGQPCDDPAPAVGDAVIHSFWVPRLAGKQDVVPGRTNTMTIEADVPGTYPGQCAEFCGMSHAFMKFKVVADTPADFQSWVTSQQAPAPEPAAGTSEAAGLEAFKAAGCIGCHTDTPVSQGIGGPNLTHFASRDCFAGCMLENTPDNLAKWLHDPAAVKPGSFMPNLNLSDQQVADLVAYLESLK
jgi:cytochrome c oxidase subunit 2